MTFNLQELPDGQSQRSVSLEKGDLDLEDEVALVQAVVDVEFYKTNHFLEIKLNVAAEAEMVCDRSLKAFNEELKGAYHILFEPNLVDESEGEKGAVRQIPHGDLKINITDEVRDTIMLNVPVKKIHPDFFDSNGNLKDFETKKFGPEPDNDDEIVDPRWAALKKLK